MNVTYGADYSASELSPSELDDFTDYDIRFLIRYIGWPGNPKCISHYPGAYQAHVIQAAKAGGHAAWLWLCGSEPTASELAQGWPHIYQWNNGAIRPGGLDADLDWAYPGVLDTLHAASPPAPGQLQAR